MDKTVLFLRANPVKPDSRVEKEVEALVVHGFNVTVLGWDRSDNYPIRKEALNENLSMIDTYRIGIRAEFGSGIKNLNHLAKFQIAIRKFLKMNTFDVVHACDFDTAFTAYHSVNHKRTKFVYDIFDYYADAFNIPKGFKKIIASLDKQVINGADLTIICTDDRKEQIEGTTPKALITIHNTPSDNGLLKKNNSITNGRVRICYVGILQPGRLLLELGDVVKKNRELELHVGGFGQYEDYFIKLSQEYENIKFYGKLPYNQTLELESNCDIILALYEPSSRNHKFAAPNKFYEALMLGKPLIMVRDTGMSKVVQDNGLGCLIEYSAEGLTKGLNELIAIRESWEEISYKERQLYEQQYSWTTMEERLIEGYHQLFA